MKDLNRLKVTYTKQWNILSKEGLSLNAILQNKVEIEQFFQS